MKINSLKQNGLDNDNILYQGNKFLLGNGKYGYRGTLEEHTSKQIVGLNVLGFYDRYEDKWREPINLPNPLFFKTSFDGLSYDTLETSPISHNLELNIYDATLSRYSEFDNLIISSMRFLSSVRKDLLVHQYKVKAKKEGLMRIRFKVDLDIYDINGPHFKNKKLEYVDGTFIFEGTTNEDKKIRTYTRYLSNDEIKISNNTCSIEKRLQKGDEICIFTYCLIDQEMNKDIDELNKDIEFGFDNLLIEHRNCFNKKWDIARVEIDDDSQFALDYSIYHLLILEDEGSKKSIPARGVSGQTYKGAIFWDTESFILPFFVNINPRFAKNLLEYRIKTLEGAKRKAKSFNYQGAFFAWESQETGDEQCSKYNVTDPITNEPIRTYFDEKQIHISADIALVFERYISITGDESILAEGGFEVIYECALFYISRATFRNDTYHFDDVIGPDEYHDGVNDNAFTNYLIAKNIDILIKYYDYSKFLNRDIISLDKLKEFRSLIYLPLPNEKGIIEQFDGYFNLQDIYPNEVKKMVKNEREYLGFLARDTKTIKQADVISLLVMLPELNFDKYFANNYNYYLEYTEHGSSLSSSMYAILGSKIGGDTLPYEFYKKSASIDLGTEQKMYAGGIYIGGTHPASNAGAYLSVVYGFAGLYFDESGPHLNPHLPKNIKKIKFKFYYKNKLYQVDINKNKYSIKEAIYD